MAVVDQLADVVNRLMIALRAGFHPRIMSLVHVDDDNHLVIRVLSPDETAPELRGKLRLRDIEATGEDDERNFRMHIGKQRLRAYAEACAWLERDIRTFCDARQIRFFTCMTDEPVAKILFDGAVRSEMVR